jgi:hypothetical protein
MESWSPAFRKLSGKRRLWNKAINSGERDGKWATRHLIF